MFDSMFRGVYSKLQNAIGKRRDLYHKPPKTEVHPRDIRRWEKLEAETSQQLEQTQRGLTALANATANQVQIDEVWMEFGQLYGQAKKQRVIAEFRHRKALSAVNLEIQGARYEMMALLDADAAQELQMKLAYREGKGLLTGKVPANGEEEAGS